MASFVRTRYCPLLGLIVLLGLVLRIAAAQGGIWTDEAWSVLYAQEAGGPLGVITAINHDNNHHLNSWWLQLVGADASSMAMRMLSIVTSTASILVAALIGQRRGAPTALITALLFAVSPIMMLYGSEARGYAPMLLCLLVAIWRVQCWMETPDAPFPAVFLAFLTVIGSLGHMLMIPGIAIISLWVFAELFARHGFQTSVAKSIHAMAPAIIAALSVLVLIIVMAAQSPLGMRVGGYTPFAWDLYAIALGDLAGLMTGIGPIFGSPTLALGLSLLLIAMAVHLRNAAPRHWLILIAALCLVIPLAVILLHPGNSQYARYHLPCAVGMLLLAGHWLGSACQRKGRAALLAFGILAILISGNLRRDAAFIANQRGNSDLPVRVMTSLAPAGAQVRITAERARAILAVAAAQRGYHLSIVRADCGPQRFLLVDRTGEGPAKPSVVQCSTAYDMRAFADANSASGQSWTLYEKVPLPSPNPAVNSAPPRR